jgi:uncharacterized membrane protein
MVRTLKHLSTEVDAEIRVHISKSWFEKDSFTRATRLFSFFELHRTSRRNSVLIYCNTRKKTFAIIADEAACSAVGQSRLEQIARVLRDDLLSTYYENALTATVQAIGADLKKHFPIDQTVSRR